MAERRMMSKTVIETDAFMDMPFSSQALYFHLLLRADDDGFIKSPKAIMRLINARDDDMKVLIAKQYVIAFESGVVVVKHWRIHNYIQKDRYHKTDCDEAQMLAVTPSNEYLLKDNMDTSCTQVVSKMDTEVRLGKDSIGKDSIGKVSIGECSGIGDKSPKTPAKTSKKSTFTPPTLEEVNAYIMEKGIHNVSAKKFVDYYEAGNWCDAKGNKVKSWKQKVLTWARHDNGNNSKFVKKTGMSAVDEALAMLDD